MTLIKLRGTPDRLRSTKTRSTGAIIERDGGMYDAGLIRGAAVITVGEALGHGFWIDQEFVDSVATQLNRQQSGSKVRFTHPDMSGDGLGKHLGKMKDAEVDGRTVRADLHFTETSHDTPDGDLATYVMNLADESPEDFGLSIVFERDRGAMDRHRSKYTDKGGNFKSPDPANANNLPHVRLAVLHGVDVVDEPAANPSGMFHRGPITEFEAVAEYALGLRDDAPECHTFNIHPDRVKSFLNKFLERNGLEIVQRQHSAPLSARRSLRSRNGVSVTIHNS